MATNKIQPKRKCMATTNWSENGDRIRK